MRYFLILGLALLAAMGCSTKKMAIDGRVSRLEDSKTKLANAYEAQQIKMLALDKKDNEWQTQLALSQREARIFKEQRDAIQAQLNDTTRQLAEAQKSKLENEKRVKTMTASLERRGSITIEPNSSIQRSLPMINLPNFQTTRVDDVIRIVVPADQLFDPNAAKLRPGAEQLLRQLSAELRRLYPHQIICVEGHTDQRPPLGAYRNPRELSVAWAVAACDAMVYYAGMPSEQLFVAGHGQYRPKFSNGTTGIEPRNRRIELVIYPEMFGR